MSVRALPGAARAISGDGKHEERARARTVVLVWDPACIVLRCARDQRAEHRTSSVAAVDGRMHAGGRGACSAASSSSSLSTSGAKWAGHVHPDFCRDSSWWLRPDIGV